MKKTTDGITKPKEAAKVIASEGVVFIEADKTALIIDGFKDQAITIKDWYIISPSYSDKVHNFKFWLTRLLWGEAFDIQEGKHLDNK